MPPKKDSKKEVFWFIFFVYLATPLRGRWHWYE